MLSLCLPSLLSLLLLVPIQAQVIVPVIDVTDETCVRVNAEQPVLFQFGQVSTWAKQKFWYESAVTTRPMVADCFCDGDSFAIFVDGEFYSYTDEGSIDINSTKCLIYDPDPEVCYYFPYFEPNNSPRWTIYSGTDVPPGRHEVEIFTLASPFGQGRAVFWVTETFYNKAAVIGEKAGLSPANKNVLAEFRKLVVKDKLSKLQREIKN